MILKETRVILVTTPKSYRGKERCSKMPGRSNDAICQAVLQFVSDSRFPESDSLVSAEFPVDAIPAQLQALSDAGVAAEVSVSSGQ